MRSVVLSGRMEITLQIVQSAALCFVVVRLYVLDMDVVGLRRALAELLAETRAQHLNARLGTKR
jgi:hypothetical protein